MKPGLFVIRITSLLLAALLLLVSSPLASLVIAEPDTTFTVNTIFDGVDYLPGDGICATAPPDNLCTLRAATMEANALVGENTILLPAGTYILTQIGADEDASLIGDLDITESLNILGDEMGDTIIDAASLDDRVIEVLPTAEWVSISRVRIQNGHTAGKGGGIYANAPLKLSDVTLRSNVSDDFGGGVFSWEPLTLISVTVDGNSALTLPGGGIFVTDYLTMTDSIVSNNYGYDKGGGLVLGLSLHDYTANINDTNFISNTAFLDGGGIYNEGGILFLIDTNFEGNYAYVGGAIFNKSSIDLAHVNFIDNRAIVGGAIANEEASVIDGEYLFFDHNHCKGHGGAIYNLGELHLYQARFFMNDGETGGAIWNSGFINLDNSSLVNNSAYDFGGGIYNERGTIYGHDNVFSYNSCQVGGAIFNESYAIHLDRSIFFKNITDAAPAILNNFDLSLSDSTIISNTSNTYAGGILNGGNMDLRGVTISGNQALNGSGGGIFTEGQLTIENSTISGNSSTADGGGIYNSIFTGIYNSTITGNQASSNGVAGNGGGVYTRPFYTFIIRNSIIYGNHHKSGSIQYSDDCNGTLLTQHYNLVGTISGCILENSQGYDLLGVDPLLGPLADNGGATLTHALQAGSPAIDTANPLGCRDSQSQLFYSDQRSYVRQWDGNGDGIARCDIGAYEFGSLYKARALNFLPLMMR